MSKTKYNISIHNPKRGLNNNSIAIKWINECISYVHFVILLSKKYTLKWIRSVCTENVLLWNFNWLKIEEKNLLSIQILFRDVRWANNFSLKAREHTC